MTPWPYMVAWKRGQRFFYQACRTIHDARRLAIRTLRVRHGRVRLYVDGQKRPLMERGQA